MVVSHWFHKGDCLKQTARIFQTETECVHQLVVCAAAQKVAEDADEVQASRVDVNNGLAPAGIQAAGRRRSVQAKTRRFGDPPDPSVADAVNRAFGGLAVSFPIVFSEVRVGFTARGSAPLIYYWFRRYLLSNTVKT